jgi:hypothetical protein
VLRGRDVILQQPGLVDRAQLRRWLEMAESASAVR